MSLVNKKLERDLTLELKKDWTVEKIEVTDECLTVELSGENINRGNTAFKVGLQIMDISKDRFPLMGTTNIDNGIFKVQFKPKKDGA